MTSILFVAIANLVLLSALVIGRLLFFQVAAGPASWLDIVSAGGLPGALILVIWAFITEQIVTGKAYRREVERGDKWEDAYKTQVEGLGTATKVVERVTSAARSGGAGAARG